jgi:hypothetical protein
MSLYLNELGFGRRAISAPSTTGMLVDSRPNADSLNTGLLI